MSGRSNVTIGRQQPMTQDERIEWEYRKDERLGILTEGDPATIKQIQLAEAEADRWLEETRKQNL